MSVFRDVCQICSSIARVLPPLLLFTLVCVCVLCVSHVPLSASRSSLRLWCVCVFLEEVVSCVWMWICQLSLALV